MFISTCVIK